MTDLRDAAHQALEALEDACGGRCNAEYNPCWQQEAAQALKAALEQPVQEPVARFDERYGGPVLLASAPMLRDGQLLYTDPPRRKWQSLSEEEIQSVIQLEREKRFQRRPPLPLSMTELSHAIEAALRSKNHE